jgi:outer membrane protein assembly factor BamB
MRCPYCGAGLERTLPRQEETDSEPYRYAQPQIVIQTSTFSVPPERVAKAAAATAAGTAGAAACSGVAIMLFIFLLVGGILAAVFFLDPYSPVTLNPPPLQVHDPFILVPSAADGPADVVAMSYDLSDETYAVGRLSLTEKKFLWRAPAVESISDVRQLAANDTTLFLVEKDTHLKALSLADGSLLWQSELVDKIGYGETPLSVQGDRVVAISQDYTLQAFDAATGKMAWSRRLESSASDFTLLSQSVAVIDDADEQTSLFLLNLSDGSERARITPSCERPDSPGWTSEISTSSAYVFSPGADGTLDSGALYFLYGSSPSCVERWDTNTAALVWQSVDTENSVPWSNDAMILVTPETVYYANDNQLWAVTQATAERKLLLENEDYEPLPLTMAGDALILRVRRSRGSERFELWSVNPATGAQNWTYNLGESKPFQPPNEQVGSFSSGDSAWDWQLSGDQLVLFKAVTNPNQFIAETLNVSDGTVAQTHSTPIETWSEDSYWMDGGVWKGPFYWANAETKMLVFNTSTGEMQYSYP